MNSRLGGVAAEDDAVPRAGEARVLHADVVLVGEEVRQAVVGLPRAEHVARGDRPLAEGVGPVLDADPLAVERVLGAGDVAGGEHAGRAGPQVLVDEDPVADGEAGPGGELACAAARRSRRRRSRTRAWRPSLVRTRSTAPSPSKASTLVPMQHAHAVIGVDVAVDAAHLAAQHALQRNRVGGRRR